MELVSIKENMTEDIFSSRHIQNYNIQHWTKGAIGIE